MLILCMLLLLALCTALCVQMEAFAHAMEARVLLAILRVGLADGPMYAFAHGPLRLVLVLVIDTFALMLLLNAIRSRLES